MMHLAVDHRRTYILHGDFDRYQEHRVHVVPYGASCLLSTWLATHSNHRWLSGSTGGSV